MSGSRMSDLPDFERDMPLTKADIDALWRARGLTPMTDQEYLDFLSSIAIYDPRKTDEPWPEPFEL